MSNPKSSVKITEINSSLLLKRNITPKFFILPMQDNHSEKILDSKLKFSEKNLSLVNELNIFNIGDYEWAISKINIPCRSQRDQSDLESILTKISIYVQTKNLNQIHISFPVTDLQNILIVKNALYNVFNNKQINIILHLDTIKYLSDEQEIEQVLKDFHTLPTGGHQGASRTIKRIKKEFFWPGMSNDIVKYIKKCKLCQVNKVSRNPKIPMKISSISSKPFERVYLDIVGPLPLSYSGNKYLLTFQDDLSKFSEAIPITNTESKTLAEIFATNIVCRHGIPESILTDQGSNLISGMFAEVSKLLKIKRLKTTPYHPQTNGALERSHRTLAEYLRSYVTKDTQAWDTWIPYAMFVYNTTPHSSTNYTPHELLYGFPAEIPNNLKSSPTVCYNYDNYANELKARLQHSYKIAKDIAMVNKEKSKLYYDKNSVAKTFQVGDKVLLRTRVRDNKLSPLWSGPYEIMEINSPENSTLRINNKEKRVHNNDLKLFY